MITLAATFNPRGEIPRFKTLLPQLQAVYAAIVISLPPAADHADLETLQGLPGISTIVNQQWGDGRYNALKLALATDPDHIQYADLDRLIRWVETRPAEWLRTLADIQQSDCLVIGRTAAAWDTHPRAMFETERIINMIFSQVIGRQMDFGAGSKGFSRRAAEFIMGQIEPGRALGADTEWIVLLHRAGFAVGHVEVDGLDWEIPDQYQDAAADRERQRAMAVQYDADAKHWRRRVAVAHEIIEAGLAAMLRPLDGEV